MGETDKIGGLAEDAVEVLTKRSPDHRNNKVARFLWNNAFPVICGLIVTAAATWVTDVAKSHSETKREFVNFQLETDYKFRRTEEALHTLAAENVALRKLLEEEQVMSALTTYKVDWLHPPTAKSTVGPLVPTVAPTPVDWAKVAEEMKKHLGATAKVNPEDLERLLASKRPIYEQRQAPNMGPAGGR
jgi:hypothetical protein